MKNGSCWTDDRGELIQAHGGMILEHEGVYYWYGEHKGAPNVPGTRRVDVIGVSCYSSRDLKSWHYEGLVLPAQPDDPASHLHPSRVAERPKVLYNRQTGRFVLWLHVDSPDYTFAGAGCAVSDSPTGPFHYLRGTQPNRRDCRDMNVFTDDDGSAWLIHSGDWNHTLYLSRLTDDYTSFTGEVYPAFIDQTREAPAVIKRNGLYYMITSGCTGWAPNPALYAATQHLTCGWKLIDNPCLGEGARTTYGGQSACLFEVNGQAYLLLDHWNPTDLMHSGYSILPVTLENGRMEVAWQDETF